MDAENTQVPPAAAAGLRNGREMQLGTFRPVLGDVLVLGALKQLFRGGLIYLTDPCGGRFFCARRGFFPADHKLQREKSI